MEIGYFNADSLIDVAVTNYWNGTMSVLLGLPGLQWGSPTTYPVYSGELPSVHAVDINLDNCIDLICGTPSDARVFLGDCDGNFSLKVTLPYTRCHISSGDMNGDGKLDILATGFANNTVGVWLNLTPSQVQISGIVVAPGEDPTHVTSHSPQVQWLYPDSVGALQDSVRLQVGADFDWTIAELWDTTIVGGAFDVPYDGDSLEDGFTYYLRIQSYGGGLASDWAETQFHMNTPPPPPTPLYPTGGQEVSTVWPEFKVVVNADAEADTQDIFIAFFDHNGMQYDNEWLYGQVAGDTLTWTSTYGMLENEFYFWYTTAFDRYESSDSAATWDSLYVNTVNEAPSAPVPLGPKGDSIVYNMLPVYHWSPSPDPDLYDTVTYTWILSMDSLFQFKSEKGGLPDTTFADTLPLTRSRFYWWKVKAEDNHGLSVESAVAKFKVYWPGDVNLSGTVTSADLIEIVNYVFKGGTLLTPECAADYNVDGAVNAVDLISAVNYLFKGFREPDPACAL